MTIELYHGSNETLKEIKNDGIFGGIFAASESAAKSHGNILHKLEIEESKVLTNYHLNYEADYEAVRDVILENINECDEGEFEEIHSFIVEDKSVYSSLLDEEKILEILGVSDLADAGWFCQKVRGLIAKKLGFDAVEMKDEHGTVYLVLSCERISII